MFKKLMFSFTVIAATTGLGNTAALAGDHKCIPIKATVQPPS